MAPCWTETILRLCLGSFSAIESRWVNMVTTDFKIFKGGLGQWRNCHVVKMLSMFSLCIAWVGSWWFMFQVAVTSLPLGQAGLGMLCRLDMGPSGTISAFSTLKKHHSTMTGFLLGGSILGSIWLLSVLCQSWNVHRVQAKIHMTKHGWCQKVTLPVMDAFIPQVLGLIKGLVAELVCSWIVNSFLVLLPCWHDCSCIFVLFRAFPSWRSGGSIHWYKYS